MVIIYRLSMLEAILIQQNPDTKGLIASLSRSASIDVVTTSFILNHSEECSKITIF